MWAFDYDKTLPRSDDTGEALKRGEKTAEHLWSAIPLDSDIVVTHTPPYHHCDEFVTKRRAMGCEDLRRALWRVRPRLAVCGHVHEGRGVERVRWDIMGNTKAPYAELGVARWEDPSAAQGSKKLSLVNLTARGGWEGALDNDGSHPVHRVSSEEQPCHVDDGVGVVPGFSTRGIGGNPETSMRCDRNALCGRMGRRETCVANCAIAATSWPHVGGKRFNKPIVVDLDLPIIED